MQDSGHQNYQISLVSSQMYTDPLCQTGNNLGSALLLFIHLYTSHFKWSAVKEAERENRSNYVTCEKSISACKHRNITS